MVVEVPPLGTVTVSVGDLIEIHIKAVRRGFITAYVFTD